MVILQEFDLEFKKSKSKKSLVFTKLLCGFPYIDIETIAEDSFADESLFLISTIDPGMETSLYISKHEILGPSYPKLIIGEFDTNPKNTTLLATLFIIVVPIVYSYIV